MRGELVEEVELTARGLAGDRAYALVDKETGAMLSAKGARTGACILRCRAEFLEDPGAAEPPPVRITLADGTAVTSDDPGADAVLERFFGRPVTLEAVREDYHPEIETVDHDLRAAFFAAAGLESPVPGASFFDLMPLTMLTTSTLETLHGLRPETRWDERRFRMNVIVRSPRAGFPEHGWTGRELRIGEAVRVKVGIAVARCVITTLEQDGLAKDPEVLRTLAQANRILEVEGKLYPCAGVYATVQSAGPIRTGDEVGLA
jgi:uncharacterized protein YcbX